MPPVPQPSQSGQIPSVPQPYQSGQIPPVAAPQQAPPYAAGQPQATAPLPVIQPVGQVTGAHLPGQHGSQGPSTLLRVGVIAAIAAALLLIVTLILVIFKPFGLFEEQLQVDRPSTTQVEDAFGSATIPEPDLATFSYIDDEDLELGEVGGFKAGEVQYSKSGGSTEAYCEASAEAEYENASVSVRQPLTMRMDYDKQNQSWKAGSVREGTVSATPEGPADIDAITDNFLNILKTYDAKIAELYVGAETTATSSLTKKGGTATFTVTKAEGETSRTCTANADITWSDTSGWNVGITSLSGDIEVPEETAQEETPPATEEEPPAETITPEAIPPSDSSSGGSASGGGSGNAGDGATMGLVCFTGDLVEVPGTIQFDNSGAILLKTDARYRVILDGRTYVVDYFEIGVRAGAYHNGQHVTLIGEISYRGAIAQAPLFINANY